MFDTTTKKKGFLERNEKSLPIMISCFSLFVAASSLGFTYLNYRLSTEDLKFSYFRSDNDLTELSAKGLKLSRSFVISNTSNIDVSLIKNYCTNLQVSVEPRFVIHRTCNMKFEPASMPLLIKAGSSQVFQAKIEIEAGPKASKIISSIDREKLRDDASAREALSALAKEGITIYDTPIPGGPSISGYGTAMSFGEKNSLLDFIYGTEQGFKFYITTGRGSEFVSPHFTFTTTGGGF